ncbi:MAG: hypothetical protein ACRD0K_28885 [Egibacteraceae bacterium]
MTGISRLALVEVSWSIWGYTRPKPPEWRAELHAKLLEDLLTFRQGASASILHTPQEQQLHDLVRAGSLDLAGDPLLAPYRWFAQRRPPSGWVGESAALGSVALIRDGLAECEALIDRAWLDGSRAALAAQLNLFACRIAVGSARTPGDGHGPDLPSYLCLELRFKEHLKEYWLYTSFSIWTHRPQSEAHAPQHGARPPDAGPWTVPEGVEQLRAEYYEQLRRSLRRLIPDEFPRARMAILERQHRAPRFWIVKGDALPADPASLPRRAENEVFGALVDVLLGAPDPHTTGVAAGVLQGNALVLRRYIPRERGDLPSYLIVPWGGTGVQQEDRTRELVTELTDLVASTSAALFLIGCRVDSNRGLIEVYGVIAQRAARLWDQLALYLPTAKGRQLAKAHRYIELIHQVLLQGIADLDLVVTDATAEAQRIEDTAYGLGRRFERAFTERTLAGHQSIRESLTMAGYFDKARQEAEDACQAAAQVRDTYKALLEGITFAFDERRARQTDLLQGFGLAFAVLLGLAAVVPEVAASVLQAYYGPHIQAWIAGGGFALIAGVAVVTLRIYRRRGVLLSKHYAEQYEKLRAFLERCASDRLSRLQEGDRAGLRAAMGPGGGMDQARQTVNERWNQRDKELAEQCARLLDDLPALKARRRPASWKPEGVGLDRWGHRVERWALNALLVSERPRTFRSAPLPRLCLLYRCYPIIGRDLAPAFDRLPDSWVVSDSDFRSVIVTQVTNREDAVEEIVRWSRRKAAQLKKRQRDWEDGGAGVPTGPAPATAFVKELDDLGIRAQMDPEEVERMLNRMRGSSVQDIWSHERPAQSEVVMHS